MRIRRVFVEKLFGHFDHRSSLKMDDRITIIHAPNGFGKTTLLRMIDGLFNARYSELAMFPFAVLGVELDDGRTVRVEKGNGKREERKRGGGKPDLSRCCSPVTAVVATCTRCCQTKTISLSLSTCLKSSYRTCIELAREVGVRLMADRSILTKCL